MGLMNLNQLNKPKLLNTPHPNTHRILTNVHDIDDKYLSPAGSAAHVQLMRTDHLKSYIS
jgi:hypothetical protein